MILGRLTVAIYELLCIKYDYVNLDLFNPLKCTGVRELHLKVFNVIQI